MDTLDFNDTESRLGVGTHQCFLIDSEHTLVNDTCNYYQFVRFVESLLNVEFAAM